MKTDTSKGQLESVAVGHKEVGRAWSDQGSVTAGNVRFSRLDAIPTDVDHSVDPNIAHRTHRPT